MLETAMAVRLETLSRGRVPRTLAEISRERLPEIPTDSWGQPLSYRMGDGQPVIYSIGPDGIDNGGKPLDRAAIHGPTPGDLVFGRLAERTRRRR